MNNRGWRTTRKRLLRFILLKSEELRPADFEDVRVHDLRHTFSRRLRAADVPLTCR